MSGLNKTIPAAIGALALAAAAAPAGAVTVNAGWSDACGASNCFSQGSFTHTWSANGAGGPITVSQLALARSILGDLDGQTFRLSFQINGQEIGTWGSYTMGGIAGDELNFWGENFTWNPEDGDLMLVLQIDVPDTTGGGSFRRTSSSRSSPTEDGPGPSGQNGDEGPSFAQEDGGDRNQQPSDLGPGFSAVVPEPATWALMIGGFGMTGTMFRRRRALAA
ncbi:PEPxxWA-CTERM sorting domain-containing protein [Phenylobacterium sp.]|uniref:PEPxxWA-CTERM sorting domain-containing protein n=1 Tax=Phenylobacterium sp. TaxID=1871053 RepID=UPI0025CCA1C3|nr:PEPxxWA-CTERM sorting domain-containing protein [Phenylobacterium sp.]MBX3482593.1 PEP-CTERM sorting domain-containing protein [Phenylobacterium sp.]